MNALVRCVCVCVEGKGGAATERYKLLNYLFVALSGSTASHLCLFRNTDTYGVTRAHGSRGH